MSQFPGRLIRSLGSLRRKGSGVLKEEISSFTQSCPSLHDPMNLSTPGLPVHH